MPNSGTTDLISRLSNDISNKVGNGHEDDLEGVSSIFDDALDNALRSFNSRAFDDDGFIKRMSDIDIDGKDKDIIKNILGGIKSDFLGVETLNQNELLMRRDLNNICIQMPEMADTVKVIRDSIIECDVSTGEVSRSLNFENHENSAIYESSAKEIEKNHDLLMAIKNFIVPSTLRNGEAYVQVSPYSKLFAELEAAKESKYGYKHESTVFYESIPNKVLNKFKKPVSLFSEDNVKTLMESVSSGTKVDISDEHNIESGKSSNKKSKPDSIAKEEISSLLQNIEIENGSSVLMNEMGVDGFQDFIFNEYTQDLKKRIKKAGKSPETHFMEAMNLAAPNDNDFGEIDPDIINDRKYSDIKGCYIKYLDPLRMVPIRMDRRVVGYYYISTTMDLQTNPAQPNGIVDLSFQNYTKDKNLVDSLANIIIKSFNKKMLMKNIHLKNEIVEIIMAHKFSEGRLSFIFIPENEVVRFIINEDENGKGHSVIEPTMFPARNYLMLTMYNMLYILNNNTTRVHYLMSSGLNKNYAAQIQRTMRKFQARRINIDDIYSYTGVLNKIGGMGEVVLPAGRNDFKAITTDTIEAVNNPINIEFLEQQRRQSLTGTGVPNLLIINAIDEVDFAKTLEMANTRFLSTVSSYKIDFNKGFTLLYQRLMKYETDLEDDIIESFRFKFNAVKQQELNITSDMINNYNNLVELVGSVYYSKKELEDEKGNPTPTMKHLRKELAIETFGQLNFDNYDEIIKKVNLAAKKDELQQKVDEISIEDEDLEEITDDK